MINILFTIAVFRYFVSTHDMILYCKYVIITNNHNDYKNLCVFYSIIQRLRANMFVKVSAH